MSVLLFSLVERLPLPCLSLSTEKIARELFRADLLCPGWENIWDASREAMLASLFVVGEILLTPNKVW
jgi:hypothetical protein